MNENTISAQELYGINQWGNGYFSLDNAGEVCVHPLRTAQSINLPQLMQHLRGQGLRLPLIIRFVDILQDRVHSLYQAFANAALSLGYEGKYTAAYPIKVNQHATVIQEILHYPHAKVGLECGSKPELMVMLAQTAQENLLICNGYKDEEYIRLALIGQRLGHQVLIIIERLSELPIILKAAQELEVIPQLGIRLRLSSIGHGKWQNSGGEKAKFGLSPTQVLQAIDILRDQKVLHWLCAMHFHMGSQIADIQDIQAGMQECAYYYVELKRLGVPLQYVDVGGGVGVDYEGTVSSSYFSVNYTLDEYALNVLRIFTHVCAETEIAPPHIITEIGRAMTAHHSVLITEIVDVEQPLGDQVNLKLSAEAMPLLHDLLAAYQQLSRQHVLESYHQIVYFWQEILKHFQMGLLTLEERAQAEQIYVAACRTILKLLNPKTRAHREIIAELTEKFVTKYFANFSLFQSLPDAWGLQQVFPVLPLAHLANPLCEYGVIEDLTCDSDGCIKHYLQSQNIEPYLQFPAYQMQTEILIGIFLVGAYQEILGDLHNLFGPTDAVNIRLTEDSYQIEHIQQGNSIADVLKSVNFELDNLIHSYQRQVKQASLTTAQQQLYLRELMAGLYGYTYLEE